MTLKLGGGNTPAPPQAPAPPPNPPMFGSDQTNAAGAQKRKQAAAGAGMFPSFLGQGTNPTNSGQKTLLGQ